MKDKVGIYYYPFPDNKRVRMYVREKNGEIEFRMRNEDDPGIWNDHGWVPYSAIQQARVLYGQRGQFDPQRAYDLGIAQVLIRDGG
ncbi:hypothetical protein DSCW_02880 [Desulfosarcina widdelii]|uniref:Uncharacterized protein n=1 Tax=Desulfosarcina widdelii TaxID=947919 RepID=A0A5K7Z0B6_9BACT|nr:hypothetical protein [Desulfosarcina widdelii]BBO72871.1 hypothetical protein DSCW_02880 [Desulfosarcina widdelii]